MSLPRPGVQERIMLHLRDYADYTDSVEVPFALSQMGIAMLSPLRAVTSLVQLLV